MTVRVEGVLKTPINTLAANIPIKVVTIVGAGDIVPSAESVYMTDENGQYGFDLVFGTHNIYAMFIDTFEYIGTTVANESVPSPSTINELLEFSTPIQPEIVDQIYGDFDQCISDLESHWATCTNQLSEQVTQGDAGVIQQMTVYTNDCLCACSAELVTFMEAGDAKILSESQVYTDALGTEIATCTNQLNTDLAQINSTMTACTGANETAIATLRTDMQAGDAQIVQQATAYTDICAGIVEADMINLVQACDARVYTCMTAINCCIEAIEVEATTVYRQDSAPTDANPGDVWYETDNGNYPWFYDETRNWVPIQDDAITSAIQDAANAQATADGKIETFFQASAPAIASEGDIWFDTDDGNKQYVYQTNQWVIAQDQEIGQAIASAAGAQATADGKVTTFYQDNPPTNSDAPDAIGELQEGDLWIDTNNGNKLFRFTTGTWVEVQDAAITELQTCTGQIVTCTAGLTGDIIVLQDDIIDVNKCIELQQSGYEIVTEAGDAKASISLLATSYSNTDVACSEILMAADKIAMHNGDPTNRSYPFVVEGDAVYMNHAFVNQLCGTCIESPDMCAGTITATTIQSSDWAPDHTNLSPVGFKIFADYIGSVTLPDGSVVVNPKALAVFNDIVARGHITAETLTFASNDSIPDSIDNTCAVKDSKNYVDSGFIDQNTYASDIADIQAQLDKSITSWFGNDTPTAFNYPANQWTTDAEKDVHLGDLYYDNDDGLSYRWSIDNNVYLWVQVVDSGIEAALAAAAAAQDTADGKRRVFFAQPVPPYDRGDLWDTGNGLRRADVTSTTVFDDSHWLWATDANGAASSAEAAAKAHADAQANLAQVTAEAYADGIVSEEEARAIADAQAKADAAEAAANAYTDSVATGLNTTIVTAQNTADQAKVDAANAQSAADGKIDTYYQSTAPTGASEGDIWVHTGQGNQQYIYASNSWISIQDTGIVQAQNTAATAVNKADQAAIDAATAQSTADGKVKTFYQTSAPTSGMNEGDIWVDTNDGNNQYMYASGAWRDIQDQAIYAESSRAEAAAKAHADAKVAAEAIRADAYADGIVSDAEEAAIAHADSIVAAEAIRADAYADGKADAAELAAIQAADAKAAAAEANAKAYADGEITASEAATTAAYRAYADAAEAAAVVTANAYADGELSQSEAEMTAAYKAYADAAENAAIVTANAHADGIVTAEEQRAIADAQAKADAAEANAKAYTDSKASTILLNVTDSFYIPDESTAESGSKVFTFNMEQAGTVLFRLVQESTPSIRSINFRFNSEVQPTIFEEDFLVTLSANKGENVVTLYDTSREVSPQAQVHLLTVTDITGNSAEEVVDNRIYPDQNNIQIKSSDYQTGVTGWAIDAAGTAEFLNLYARGLMESSTFRSGTIIGSTIYAVDTEELADPYWGTANAGTVIYYAYDSASPVAVNVPVSTVTENNPNNSGGAFATINFTDFEFYAAADNYTEYSQDRSKYPDIPANTLVGSYTFPTFTFGSTYYGTPFYRLYTTGNGTLRISFKETNGGEVSFVDVTFNPTVDTNKVVTLAGITFDVKIDSKYAPQRTGSYETGDNTHYYQDKGVYGLVISVKSRAGNFGSTEEETMNGKFSWGLNIPSPYINDHNGALYTTVNHANYKMYARADISNEDR